MFSSQRVTEAYNILGLEQGTELEVVKSTYKQIALRTHPDKNPDNPDATAEFQRVSEAYRLLVKHLDTPQESGYSNHRHHHHPFFYESSDDEGYDYDSDEYNFYDDDDDYYEDETDLAFHLWLFEQLMNRKSFGARDMRYRPPQPKEETPEEYQARVKKLREEQVAAERRREKEAAMEKERRAKERERERVAAEARQKNKTKNKKAQAQVQREKAEQAARLQKERAQTLRSAAFSAARVGDVETVKKTIWEDGVDASGGEVKAGCEEFVKTIPNDPQETLLHIAARRGDMTLVEWLDSHNAEPEEKNNDGLSAFHLALMNGHKAIVLYFFENYPPSDPDLQGVYESDTQRLLSLAIESGEPELVWMILDKGFASAEEVRNAWVLVTSGNTFAEIPAGMIQEKKGDIITLLMRYGGITPPATPQGRCADSDESETSRFAEIQPDAKRASRSDTVNDATPTISRDKQSTHDHQQPGFRGRGRGQGRGRGRGRGRARGRGGFTTQGSAPH